jgi:threonine/homoserine/homoserine lactone efflux protein
MLARTGRLAAVNSHLLVLYLVTLSLAMIVPGPDMLYVLGTGMRGGPRAVLGAIFLALEFAVDGTVGVLAGRIGRVLLNRRRARRGMDVATGGLFIGIGVRLAAER